MAGWEGLITELEGMATCLEQMGVENSHDAQTREVVLNFENTHLKLKIVWTPAGFRERAKRLIKSAKDVGDGRTDNAIEVSQALNHKISLRRSRYSKARAQQFINDGEIENYENYRRLYGIVD